jgi:hypothetical protein
MDQGFDLPVVEEYIEHKPFDPRDEFCWLEFDEKYRGKTFTSQDEVLEKTRCDLNRVFCKVEQGSGFIVKKTDCKDNLMDTLDTRSAFTDLYFKYVENDKPKELSFKRYMQIFSNNINRYRSIDFAPNNPDPKLFNLWSGFEGQMLDEDEKTLDIEPIQLILNHIKEVYCSGCEESYEYFLDLLYFIPRSRWVWLLSYTVNLRVQVKTSFLTSCKSLCSAITSPTIPRGLKLCWRNITTCSRIRKLS